MDGTYEAYLKKWRWIVEPIDRLGRDKKFKRN